MKKHFLFLLAVLLILSCTKQQTADLILINGKILTLDEKNPQVSAIATQGDKILALGTEAEINQYKGPETKLIDLEGQLAIPGLIEGHGHYMRLGHTLMHLDLRYANSWEEIVTMVKEAVEKAKPGDWILGWGWHQEKWQEAPNPSYEGLPIHHSLSAVSPNNPVMLSHTSGHGEYINAKAMELAGITAETANPAGGEIAYPDKLPFFKPF